MEKTAMGTYLEWYNGYVKNNGCSPSDYDVNFWIKTQGEQLEKKQIIKAYNERVKDTYKNRCEAIQYYTNKFNN